MRDLAMILFLLMAVAGAAAACSSSNTKRLLWGMIIASFGLGFAVEMVLEGYVGILVISVFLISDVILYLFFRTQELLPQPTQEKSRSDLIYKISMLWMVLLSALSGAAWIFSSKHDAISSSLPQARMASLHEKIWGDDWILIVALLFSLSIMATGGFFLVRKDEK